MEPKFSSGQYEEATLYELDIESSFILALKNNRFRALDLIFTKHQRNCMAELLNLVNKDKILSRKWDMYLGLDLYMPTILVWLLVRERARADIKKRNTNH